MTPSVAISLKEPSVKEEDIFGVGETDDAEAAKYLVFTSEVVDKKNTTYAELFSPIMEGKIKIKNPKVPISTSAAGFAELKYIEMQMKELDVVPDFGYEGDNFCIHKESGNGWSTLCGLLGDKNRY